MHPESHRHRRALEQRSSRGVTFRRPEALLDGFIDSLYKDRGAVPLEEAQHSMAKIDFQRFFHPVDGIL